MAERRGGGLIGLLGFMVGTVVGAVGGLLLAPKSGAETREELKTKADELVEQGKETYQVQKEKVQQMATEKSEALRSKIEEAKDKLRTQVDSATDFAKEKLDRASEKSEGAAKTASKTKSAK